MTPLEQLLKLIDSPSDYKKRLAELAKATAEHDGKLLKLRSEDARIEAHYQESVKLRAEAEGLKADALKRAAQNEAKSRELRARETSVSKDESDWRAIAEKHEASVRVREADVVRREAALRPNEALIVAKDKELADREASLKEREAKAVAFARAMMG